jgi:hypothetical protein
MQTISTPSMRGHGNNDSPKKQAFPDGDEEGDDEDGADADELDSGSHGVQKFRAAGLPALAFVCMYIYTYIHTRRRLTVWGEAGGNEIKVHRKTGSSQHVSLAASAQVYACFRVCVC